eukprot:7368142-Pyramimonas_sp.AAC.1
MQCLLCSALGLVFPAAATLLENGQVRHTCSDRSSKEGGCEAVVGDLPVCRPRVKCAVHYRARGPARLYEQLPFARC